MMSGENLMNQITKLINKILMNGASGRITPEIDQEQRSFVQDVEIRRAVFLVRIMSERAREI